VPWYEFAAVILRSAHYLTIDILVMAVKFRNLRAKNISCAVSETHQYWNRRMSWTDEMEMQLLQQQFFLLMSLFYVLLEHSITRRRRRSLHFAHTHKCCRPTEGRPQPTLIVHTRPTILYLRSTLKGERYHVLRFSCRCSDNKYGGR